MPSPASQPEKKVHQVWWEAEDWEGIMEGADIRAEETGLAVNPTDIIRTGTREYVAKLKAQQAART